MHYDVSFLKCVRLFPNVEPQENTRKARDSLFVSRTIVSRTVAATLSLGLATVKCGDLTRFARQVQITLLIRFWCAKNTAPDEIRSKMCEVYGEKCLATQHVRKWCKERRTWPTVGCICIRITFVQTPLMSQTISSTSLHEILSYTRPIAWTYPSVTTVTFLKWKNTWVGRISQPAERRGFMSQLGGWVLRLERKEGSKSHVKMHRYQQRLCKKVGKCLSFRMM